MNWLNFAIKSVMLVEAITGLDGPTKKEKAVGLSLGFASLLGLGFTKKDEDEIGNLIDGTVTLLNKEGIFAGHEASEVEEPTDEEKEETDLEMRHTGFTPDKEPETIGEKSDEKEPEADKWPLTHYTPEVYLKRWPDAQWADLARRLTQ